VRIYQLSSSGFASARLSDNAELRRFFADSLADYRGAPLSGFPALRYGPHGKPYFSEAAFSGLFFSLSHTMGFAALVFAESEVGIDAENMAAHAWDDERLLKIARRCFREGEFAYVRAAAGSASAVTAAGRGTPQEQQAGVRKRFFEIWTRKEAFMKFTGNGFSEGFQSFSVLGPGRARFDTRFAEEDPEVVVSVCAEEGEFECERRREG
jgi:phosphopantetheinyl transferase